MFTTALLGSAGTAACRGSALTAPVSTLKELARRWAPDIAGGFTKESEHLALADIRDSINELRYYRSSLIAPDYREAGVAP